MTTELAVLTQDEDTFCLAVLECGGNLGAAYRQVFGDVGNPGARARQLLLRPEIAKRVQQLTAAVEENALVSLGSHLIKLAEIRDMAIKTDQLKVALGAESKRGEVAGLYAGKSADPKAPSGPSVTVVIGQTPANVQEWAAKRGTQAVVVDV